MPISGSNSRIARLAAPYLLSLVVVLAISVFAAYRLAVLQTLPDLIDPERPVLLVSPVRQEFDSATSVEVKLEWLAGREYRNGQRSGTVTSVPDEAGPIACSSTVVSVDQIEIRAMCGSTPLHRALGSGATGPDVAALSEFLSTLGIDSGSPSDRFGSEMAVAVRSYRQLVGAPAGQTFDPSLVIFIPDGLVDPTVIVEVGDVITEGQTLMFDSPRLTSVSISADDLPALLLSGRPLALTVDGQQIQVPTQASETEFELAKSEVSTIEELSTIDTDEDLPSTLPGILSLASPEVGWIVPSDAVISSATGTCVEDSSGQTIEVELLESFARSLVVAGSLDDQMQLTNEISASTC